MQFPKLEWMLAISKCLVTLFLPLSDLENFKFQLAQP